MSTTSLPEMHTGSQRILNTLSRVEVDNKPLPNGEKTAANLTASQLLPPPVNVYVPSAERVEDDRIKRAIAANPMSNVNRPVHFGASEPVGEKARRNAAKRTGKMLDFCTPFRLGDQTRRTIPGTISIHGSEQGKTSTNANAIGQGQVQRQGKGKAGTPKNAKKAKKANQRKRKKTKLSKSQLQGRARLSTEKGERFLSSQIGTFNVGTASKHADFSMEKIQQWFNDIPEEFRVCSLPSSPLSLPTTAATGSTSLKPLNPKQRKGTASMSELIRKDEQRYQDKYKRRKSGKRNMHKKKHSKKGIQKPTPPRKEMPGEYFRINKVGLVPADQSFDAISKIVVGFDTFERGTKPKRVPPRLAQFWEHHKASGVGPKILSDGFTLSEFEVSVKKLGQLEVSKEMQAAMKEKVLQPDGRGGKTKTMTDIWSDFWVDEIGSELAAPLDSSIFVASAGGLDPDSSALQAPAFMVDDPTATANLPHAHKRFAFASHTHTAARRIQNVYHRRRAVRDWCSTKISACFRGFKARKAVKDRKARMVDSALLIATMYRGFKAKTYVNYLRTTGWNHIAILCQRCIRRHLARKEVERRRYARTYNGATNIQRIWRGIWGRQQFKRWKLYVRDRSAKSIQNMVRWYNFRVAFEDYSFTCEVAADDIQRVFRGHLSRKRVNHILLRIFSALQIQRVFRGYLGRRRFKRKMSVIRTACLTIQIRVRGILARQRAGQIRTDILSEEYERTEKEEAALSRRLEETRDFLQTNKGKMEHKENKKKIRSSRSGETAAFVLLSQRKKKLKLLKHAFELVDFRSTGFISRTQLKELFVNELHLSMSANNLDTAWAKTGTSAAQRGGYRLSDIHDQRELEELVEWYESGKDRKVGVRAAVTRASKKTAKAMSCKPGTISRLGEKKVFLRNRIERLMVFRQDRPPPFACSTCTKRFVFSYELERHLDKGKQKGKCPGKYYCPLLDD